MCGRRLTSTLSNALTTTSISHLQRYVFGQKQHCMPFFCLLQIDIWARVNPRLKINSLTFTKLFFLHFKIRNLIQKTLRIQYHKFIACENNILRSCALTAFCLSKIIIIMHCWAFCLQSKCLLKVNYLYLTCLFSKRIIYYSKKINSLQ